MHGISPKKLLSFALVAVLTFNAPARGAYQSVASPTFHVLYSDLRLLNGDHADVYSNGLADIYNKDNNTLEYRYLPDVSHLGVRGNYESASQRAIIAELSTPKREAFDPHEIEVVFRAGVQSPQDVFTVQPADLTKLRTLAARGVQVSPPAYTNDTQTNRVLLKIGVVRAERLFRQISRSRLSAMVSRARASSLAPVLDFSNAYRLHFTGASARNALTALRNLPSVRYASLAWRVSPMSVPGIPIPAKAVADARNSSHGLIAQVSGSGASSLPANYAVSTSAQSFLNSSNLGAVAAYDEITKTFHQLPGQGEIITNVSLGDLDDASDANPNNPCFVFLFPGFGPGPTTVMQGGQRYLDWPSMPLIPTYTADDSGNLNGAGEVCGVDPALGEVGLDFSMMAPLPHQLQRAGAMGEGYTDLFGIAPGATYRLVVPASFFPTFVDVDAALLGAAMQTPAPNVITASLGFGTDGVGFPGRFLEDDPLSASVISGIVHNSNIVVCISANDGLREFTNAPVNPDGGSTATNVATAGQQPTNINDVGYSTTPSSDYDDGSIDAGGTTLDDIFSSPPQWATSDEIRARHAYAETRWNGFTGFSSGYGSRVDLSAPSDNLLAMGHALGGGAQDVNVSLNGGTSASAPEIAAAAAVVMQVARLTGHPFATALQVRTFLQQTGSPVAAVPQSDTYNNVGPQINVRAAVERLMADGYKGKPAIARIGIEQRRNFGDLDADILSDTNPAKLDMTDNNQMAWITIAPDWEFMPFGVRYRLTPYGKPGAVLSTAPTARLLPQDILAAAGLPFASPASRTVHLQYQAILGNRVILSEDFPLTFGPITGSSHASLAVNVPPVITGSSITVNYDLTNVLDVSNPTLVVSEPGRVNPATGPVFHPTYVAPLSATKGTVTIPVSSLQGGGVYGIGIDLNDAMGLYSDFAYTRVQPSGVSAVRPPAPKVFLSGEQPGHFVELPYGAAFEVSYDVRNVQGANSALLEISAAGPGLQGNLNTFNNPNGTERDNNGVDHGSIFTEPLSGTAGTVTINGLSAGLIASLASNVRVVPMNGNVAVGEASEVSFVTMDGVLASDGGAVYNGWAINSSGTDGYLTSTAPLPNFTNEAMLQVFDQKTAAIKSTAINTTNVWYYAAPAISKSDISPLEYWDRTAQAYKYLELAPVSTGTAAAWTPPITASQWVVGSSADGSSDTAASLVQTNPGAFPRQYWAFSSNLSAGTTSGLYNLMAPLSAYMFPWTYQIGLNTQNNTAVIPFDSSQNFFSCSTKQIFVTVNLTSGAVSSFTGQGSGGVMGFAIDPSRNIVAATGKCDQSLALYNLTTNSSTIVKLPNQAIVGARNRAFGFYLAIDPVHQLVFTLQPFNDQALTDNNFLSPLLTYNEQGSLISSKRLASPGGIGFLRQGMLQVNPTTRQGFILGYGGYSIAPFTY